VVWSLPLQADSEGPSLIFSEASQLRPPYCSRVLGTQRFPYFQSEPVSYLQVRLHDRFWAPRQRATREVSVAWISKAHDGAGGLESHQPNMHAYRGADTVVNMEAIKFIGAMATVVQEKFLLPREAAVTVHQHLAHWSQFASP